MVEKFTGGWSSLLFSRKVMVGKLETTRGMEVVPSDRMKKLKNS
jgi:hypothetical protein